MLKKVKAAFDRLWSATSTISGILLFLNMAIIVVNIVARKGFGAPIYGSTEIVRYFSLASAAFALSQNEWFDGNVKMTLILEKLGEKASAMLRAAMDLVATVGIIYVCYCLWNQVSARYHDGTLSMDLYIPIWIINVALAIGFSLLAAAFVGKVCIEGGRLMGSDVSMPAKPAEPGLEDFDSQIEALERGEAI